MKYRIFIILNYCLLILIYSLFLNSCKSAKKNNVPIEDILQYCEFVDITSSFEMRILQYFPSGCHCGTRSCASSCVGVTPTNDTLRVLSLCNMDTTFKINQNISVHPILQPKFQVTIAQSWITEGDKILLYGLQRKNLKTTYGSLSRK